MMERKIKDHMLELGVLKRHHKFIIALSGGADSMALLEVLYRLQREYELELVAIHVHHGIRKEAEEDVVLCQKACHERNIPLYVEYRNIPQIAMQSGMSLEEAGRVERYEIFHDYLTKLGYDNIAIAHHMNDRVETMLFQLFRGSGIRGLTGIPNMRGSIIRPMLGVTRMEIEGFLEGLDIDYIVDSTNMDDKYTRNYIRNHVIPASEHVASNATRHMSQTADQLLEIVEYLQLQVDDFLKEALIRDGKGVKVSIQALQKQHIALQKEIILSLISKVEKGRKNITNKHIQDILLLLEAEGEKKLSLPNGLQVIKSYDALIIGIKKFEEALSPILLEPENAYLTGDGLYLELFLEKVEEKTNPEQNIPQNDCIKWFDYDKIHLPLFLRGRQSGDYIMIDTNGKKKSLKAYMIDEKIPKHLRDQKWLIADGNHVLWVVGKRISSYYKVTSETKNILKIHIGGNHGSKN